ncbi:hypothetical protein CIHG_08542 [Coccidioides immitis H538.4]|uniref:Uncharacterized protein n=1 Tax=Coccidioides immitis H538.4 TaxID=396776 RepID=A0A0J8S229_COCIT|nr:hypothetical protein CIHG_08542 [Coccidioides immitis H538.4]
MAGEISNTNTSIVMVLRGGRYVKTRELSRYTVSAQRVSLRRTITFAPCSVHSIRPPDLFIFLSFIERPNIVRELSSKSAIMVRSRSSSPSVFTTFIRWLRLKNYQYEVTFALYMLTPMEKFIFNTCCSCNIHHVWYYWTGGDPFTGSSSKLRLAANLSASSLPAAEMLAQQNVIVDTGKVAAETTAKRLAEL